METHLIKISFTELRQNKFPSFSDSDRILSSGLELYRKALLDNPYSDERSTACIVAVVDNLIVGHYFMFNTKLKAGDEIVKTKTGGGLLVSRKGRGIGIRVIKLSRDLDDFELYYFALFSRVAYDIIRKKETML